MARCERHGLAYDPALASGCVVCRREASGRAPASESSLGGSPAGAVRWPFLVAFVVCCAAAVAVWPRGRSTAMAWTGVGPPVPATSSSGASSAEGELTTKNESGRASYFYVPGHPKTVPVPLLVGLHGTGADGREMIGAFRALADARGFAILAPSSGYVEEAKAFTWRVGDHPKDFSPDYWNVAACLKELEGRGDVAIDHDRVLAVGFSGGASSAPYLASNTEPYTAYAVLHGGVFIGGIGARKVRGWFSTGDADPLRSRDHVFAQSQSMQNAGFDVVFTTFPGGHEISRAEAEAVVKWWLEPG